MSTEFELQRRRILDFPENTLIFLEIQKSEVRSHRPKTEAEAEAEGPGRLVQLVQAGGI
jgi:hypothetical protein